MTLPFQIVFMPLLAHVIAFVVAHVCVRSQHVSKKERKKGKVSKKSKVVST